VFRRWSISCRLRVSWLSGQRCRDSRIVKYPEETRKVVDNHAFEDARIRIRTPRSLTCAIPCELLPKHRRFALEEITVVRHTFSETCGVLYLWERARTYAHGKGRFRPVFAAIGRFTIVEVDGETYQENYVATVDVVLSVSAITLEGRLVHGEIRPISAFGVAWSQDAGSRWWTLVGWGGN